MAYCPNISDEQVVKEFNSIVTHFGGLPLSIEELKNPELRDKREGINRTSMESAYYLWNKYAGNLVAIQNDGNYSGEQGIEQLKSWVNNNQSNVQYQLPQGREQEEFVASEKTIRDLAARISDRIGIPVRFESDRTKDYKGKLEGDTAVINLAYATLDTPIHEILGHPIIRAIKNGTELSNFKYKIKELNDSNAPGKFQVETYSDENLGDVNFFDTEQEAKEYVKSLKLIAL